MIRHLVLSLLLVAAAGAAETFEERQRATDMTSADSVFELANWCKDNRMPTKASQLYRQVLRLDKDHFGANTAMGNVLVGDRWVNKAFVAKAPADGGQPQGASAPAGPRQPAGPGPSAQDVSWDVAVGADPGPADNPFLDRYIQQMRSAGNDSDAMGAAVATLLRADNWPSALPRLAKAMLGGGYGDVYGACDMIIELRRLDRMPEARKLFAIAMRASESVTDPEDLEHLAMVAISMRERKAVPRLIELLGHAAKGVQDTAREALAAITRLPERDLTPAKAKAWWDANWSLSEDRILAEQLRSQDPLEAVEAAAGLCEMRSKDIFPVLFRLLRSEDSLVVNKAVRVLQRATTLDWGISPGMPVDQRAKRVDALEKWWKEEQARFAWPGLPPLDGGDGPAGATAPDPDRDSVEMLGSTAGSEAQEAELRLRARGQDAVPALLRGLEHTNPLVRRRAHDLLRETTRQDHGFDPRADDEARGAAVARWRTWAVEQKLLPAPSGP